MKSFYRHLSSGRKLEDVFIVSHARTPLGCFQGQLKNFTAPQLGSIAIKNAIDKCKVNPTKVEEVFMGCVLQAGVGQAPARQAALGAGLPNSVASTTINKVCASGMKAMSLASTQLAVGHRKVMVAGGMESLSNTPFLMDRNPKYGGFAVRDACDFDGLTDAYSGWHMGRCAENTATNMKINKQDQDDYGQLSHTRHKAALENGVYEKEIIPLEEKKHGKPFYISQDEIQRFPFDSFAATKWGATVSVGSSSKLADGATAAVMANETGVRENNLTPLARVVEYSDAAVNPVDWPVAPAKGIQELLNRAGLKTGDISKWEINEAFAVVVLANARILGIDVNDININGGAISIGHPFGMSGARITNHLLNVLKPGEYGIASLCNGGGGAGSILIQRL